MDVRVQTSNSSRPVGCDSTLHYMYWHLCDTWGIVVQTVASLGFVTCAVLVLVLLVWSVRMPHERGRAAALLLFLLGTAGVFALTFSFVISLSAQTCPCRVFLFSVFFSIVFAALVARGLALLGAGLARGWREVGVSSALTLVQVIIAVEWLLVVLVRDEMTCEYLQQEFVMLQVYVMVLIAAALIIALRFLCRTYVTYSYSYTGQMRQRAKLQAALLVLTLLLSVCIWVVWVTLLMYGNAAMGRSPDWDDPVISIALTANGWVLLLGHGFIQVCFMCQGKACAKVPPLNFTGWTTSTMKPTTQNQPKTGRENNGFQRDMSGERGNDC